MRVFKNLNSTHEIQVQEIRKMTYRSVPAPEMILRVYFINLTHAIFASIQSLIFERLQFKKWAVGIFVKYIMSICNFSYFLFGFEGMSLVLIAPVSGHCLSFYFQCRLLRMSGQSWKSYSARNRH